MGTVAINTLYNTRTYTTGTKNGEYNIISFSLVSFIVPELFLQAFLFWVHFSKISSPEQPPRQ